MPTYKITSPDGRVLRITGDTPPNEQQLKEIFSKVQETQKEPEKAQNNKKKGIDLTPSGIANTIGSNIGAGLAAPIVAMRDNLPVNEAFEQAKTKGEEFRKNDKLSGIQDFVTDMAGYSALPVLRGGGAARFIGNAAIQGGLPGALEGLKREGTGGIVGGGGAGTGIAAALQTIPYIGYGLGKVAKKGFDLAGRFGQVKPETLQQVVKPESTALEMTPEDASNALLDITKQIRENFDKLRKSKGAAVDEAVKGLGENAPRFELKDLIKDITGTFDNYQLDRANPARDLAGGLEEDLAALVAGKTENPANYYKYTPENFSPNYSKEKEEEAFNILSQVTKKPVNWLKSQLNANTFNNGVGKRKEFIENLLEKTDDKLQVNPEYISESQFYRPDNLEDVDAGQKIAEKVFDDIINRRFNVNNIDPLSRAFNTADKNFNELLSNIAKDARNEEVYNTAFDQLKNIVKDLPEEAKAGYFDKLATALDDIYTKANTLSPLTLQGVKKTIGQMGKWGDETARGYVEPVIEQVYGKYANRLNGLSPDIAAANKAFSDLMNYKKNDAVSQILKGDLLNEGKLGGAPGALKAYKSSINKASGQNNIKDLENLLFNEAGQERFLNKIDDINAAMDLLKTENTGLGGAASIAKALLTRPVLAAVRGANRMELPQKMQTIKDMLQPIGRLMPGLGAKGAANMLYGGVEYNNYK